MRQLTHFQAQWRNPRGMSLVELMVGIALSMVTALAAMTAYKSLVNSAMSSGTNAVAQNVGAVLSVQLPRLLPQAGWGVGASAASVGGTVNQDVVLLTNASVSGAALSGTAATIGAASSSGNAVVWDSAIGGSLQCSALIVPVAGGLMLLGPVACANAAAWQTLSWTPTTTLLPGDAFTGGAFTAQKTSCWPYAAVVGGQGAVQITLTGSKSVATAVCLTNITN